MAECFVEVNMANVIEDLKLIYKKLKQLNSKPPKTLTKLKEATDEVGKSWCGSWIGYQSRIYYKDFSPVPAGAHYSIEWGTKNQFAAETTGKWLEYTFDDVVAEIYEKANVKSISKETQECANIKNIITGSKIEVKSIIGDFSKKRHDELLEELLEKITEINLFVVQDVITELSPKGRIMSRDSLAITQGIATPPHFVVYAEVISLLNHYDALQSFLESLQQIISRCARIVGNQSTSLKGDKIFIGHGHSLQWMKLKDFIKDKLMLPYEEFNRVPVAGITNVERLEEMLRNARFAFLVMTAEEEQNDGVMRARMNVIHEVGLFQGKLGFSHAIVILEDGCQEFSNIQGLGQIRFQKNNISSCFEQIRDVLVHHGIVT